MILFQKMGGIPAAGMLLAASMVSIYHSTQPPTAVEEGPLTADLPVQDLGRLRQGVRTPCYYRLTNTSSETVYISRIIGSCSCTSHAGCHWRGASLASALQRHWRPKAAASATQPSISGDARWPVNGGNQRGQVSLIASNQPLLSPLISAGQPHRVVDVQCLTWPNRWLPREGKDDSFSKDR